MLWFFRILGGLHKLIAIYNSCLAVKYRQFTRCRNGVGNLWVQGVNNDNNSHPLIIWQPDFVYWITIQVECCMYYSNTR